jgi:hypothetical protein
MTLYLEAAAPEVTPVNMWDAAGVQVHLALVHTAAQHSTAQHNTSDVSSTAKSTQEAKARVAKPHLMPVTSLPSIMTQTGCPETSSTQHKDSK